MIEWKTTEVTNRVYMLLENASSINATSTCQMLREIFLNTSADTDLHCTKNEEILWMKRILWMKESFCAVSMVASCSSYLLLINLNKSVHFVSLSWLLMSLDVILMLFVLIFRCNIDIIGIVGTTFLIFYFYIKISYI